ncbi:MAG: 50S ribosomal protein L10 [Clostridia bacterium]|nr:50S ribosomal protein L10 [Clostridia bacterium]
MPSAKILAQKQQAVVELTEKLKGAAAGVILDYQGINVADDTALRNEFRKAGIEYAVIKNSLLRFAAQNADLAELDKVLEGTTSLAISANDTLAPAKVVATFMEKNQSVRIKAGFYDGKVVDADTVVALSKIPPKEVLISKMLGSFNSPITSLVIALDAIREKNEQLAG